MSYLQNAMIAQSPARARVCYWHQHKALHSHFPRLSSRHPHFKTFSCKGGVRNLTFEGLAGRKSPPCGRPGRASRFTRRMATRAQPVFEAVSGRDWGLKPRRKEQRGRVRLPPRGKARARPPFRPYPAPRPREMAATAPQNGSRLAAERHLLDAVASSPSPAPRAPTSFYPPRRPGLPTPPRPGRPASPATASGAANNAAPLCGRTLPLLGHTGPSRWLSLKGETAGSDGTPLPRAPLRLGVTTVSPHSQR